LLFSEIERGIIDDLLHDEEGPGLADARQGDQLLAMDAVEILYVADPDLEEIVEIARHQVAIQHEFELRDRPLERGEALRVERSSTTPTITSAPLPTLRGATMALTCGI